MEPRLLTIFVSTIVIPLVFVAAAGTPAGVLALQMPDTEPLIFYLHGDDVPGTADGFTMTPTPSSARILRLDLTTAPSWYSSIAPSGAAFAEGATFTLVKPCIIGLSLSATYTLALTDVNGNEVETLGQTTQPLGVCLGREQIRIPVQTPVEPAEQRLKLTMSAALGLTVNLPLGAGTYLKTTGFVVPPPSPPPSSPDVLFLSAHIDGIAAGAPPGPSVRTEDSIALEVAVTNASPAPAGIREATSSLGRMACDDAALSPGQSTICRTTGIAAEGRQRVTVTMAGESRGESITAGTTVYYVGFPLSQPTNSFVAVDASGRAETSSLALDAAGNPVISYYAEADLLKVLHCGNSNCSAGNSTVTVDTWSGRGDTSLALDAAGNPVISYQETRYVDYFNGGYDLKVLHCGDPNCSAGNSIVTADATGYVEGYSSLALDAAGNPVISYNNDDALRVLRCATPDCGSYSRFTVDTTGVVSGSSLALDAAGNPIVSYSNRSDLAGENGLKVLHCDNPTCSGNNNLIVNPDRDDPPVTDDVRTSLALDATGHPVVAYRDRLMRCGGSSCASGPSRTIVQPGGPGIAEPGTLGSLALDAFDRPVISYGGNGGLTQLHCGEPTCQPGVGPRARYDVGIIQWSGWVFDPVFEDVVIDVLANDRGIGQFGPFETHAGLKITYVSTPYHGTATLTPEGIRYTPDPNVWAWKLEPEWDPNSGTWEPDWDSIYYTITDANGQTATTFVQIGIEPCYQSCW